MVIKRVNNWAMLDPQIFGTDRACDVVGPSDNYFGQGPQRDFLIFLVTLCIKLYLTLDEVHCDL